MKRYPTVLTIAGSDSGGGAGIQADIKTISAIGAFATSAITALTAQNTCGVNGILPVSPEFLKLQLEAVFDDFTIDAVKVGMVNTVAVASVISDILDRYKPPFVVFDPVMVSTSGAKLIQDETVEALWGLLLHKADLITPNLDEAEILTGRKITTVEEMKQAATEMILRGCKGVLLKGGHLAGVRLFDVLIMDRGEVVVLETPFIQSKNVHGTGCTLSSAIASYVSIGQPVRDAVFSAKEYISEAIRAGSDIVTGHGSGPLNHAFSPQRMFIKS